MALVDPVATARGSDTESLCSIPRLKVNAFGLYVMRHAYKSLLWFALFALTLAPSAISAQNRFVRTQGKEMVTPDGRPLLLKGIGLGNWLLPEGYMFKFKTTNSPRLIEAAINQLVGEDEARKFWQTYRENYITRSDIRFL